MGSTTTSRSNARELATRLAKLTHQYLDGKLELPKLAKELRALADWIDPAGVTQQPVEAPTGVESEIFRYWQQRMGKPNAKLTPDRRAKIRARLKEGYTPAQIKQAIDAVANSPFHRGSNENGQEYVDLTLICRTGSKLEQHIDQGGAPEPLPDNREESAGTEQEARLHRLQREAAKQLAAGETDAYNETQQEIRRIRGGPTKPNGGGRYALGPGRTGPERAGNGP